MRPANKRKRSGREKRERRSAKVEVGEGRREKMRERGGMGRNSSCFCLQRAYSLAEEYWTI